MINWTHVSAEIAAFFSKAFPLTQDAAVQTFSFVATVWGAFYVKRLLTAKINMLPFPSPLFPFADVVKNLSKSQIVPERAGNTFFALAPAVAVCCFLFLFLLMPFGEFTAAAFVQFGTLYMVFIIYAGVYAFVLSGFSTGSRFAFLGSVRALMRLLCVQPVLCLVVAVVLMSAQSTRLHGIIEAQRAVWFIVPHFPMAVIFVACTLALSNNFRFEAPFSQKELASGIYADYSAGLYLFLFWSDYALTVFMAMLGAFLFLGGTLAPFGWTFLSPEVWLGLKTAVFFLVFAAAENTLPDYRSDQLLRVAFKRLLPVTIVWTVLTAIVCLSTGGGRP